MNELEFLEQFRKDKQIFESYAIYVSTVIQKNITEKLRVDLDHFCKIPVSFRLKTEESLIQKAFYRNKNYKDPYNDITDKIGGRIVVLLEEEARMVCEIIESLEDFSFSKDRDIEQERLRDPELFNYKSHHYILRNKAVIADIPENTAVEIQIRTLLQHAYSELTHDTIYKPNTIAAPEVKRSVAKCMALIEVADQLFGEVNTALRKSTNQFNTIINDSIELLRDKVSLTPDDKICNLILDAYLPDVEIYNGQSLRKFLLEYSFILDKIKERSKFKYLYKQPIIIFLYMLVQSKRKIVKARWPLSLPDLEEIFTDLGFSFDRS